MPHTIASFPVTDKHYPKEAFSIVIPTWNNLRYAQLCVESLQKNSVVAHQIILHVNDGSDGTLEWAQESGLDYTVSSENVGVCWAVNSAAHLAQTDYIVYMNDDMYALPDWDRPLIDEIQRLDHDLFFLSATMLEPRDTSNPCVIVCADCGDDVSNFNETQLLQQFNTYQKADWSGATWPPNVVSKRVWNLIGGYSVEFSPGMYSDPDFSMKLWQLGVRYFKGLSQSRVFHFQCKTTGRIVKNDGKKQFLSKWKIASSRFMKQYLKRGQTWSGPLTEPKPDSLGNLKDKLRLLLNH